MNWNILFLLVFVVLMIFCCGGMMKMGKRGHGRKKEDRKNDHQ